jgi:ribonucleoside-triphosphate reductase
MCVLSFVGLSEMVKYVTGKSLYEEDALKFANQVVSYLSRETQTFARQHKLRISLGLRPNLQASFRLAQLDVERHGLGKVEIQGNREKPHYTSMMVVPAEADISLEERLCLESRFQILTKGSQLSKVPLGEFMDTAEQLISISKRIIRDHKIGLYVFDRSLTYCSSCLKTFHGEKLKCPKCGSVNAVTCFCREPARYKAKQL